MAEAAAPCPCWNMHVTENLQGRLIYKDECVKCFLTPKDDHGIAVDLTSFVGLCDNPAEGHNHLQSHFAKTQHPLYCKIKLTPKAAPAEGE